MATRDASHAGSWYESSAQVLRTQLGDWLQQANDAGDTRPSDATGACRAVIAPHAGYSFSGQCAAHAYRHLNPTAIKRVFLLGPSHHHFTRRCCLTECAQYDTPLGSIKVRCMFIDNQRCHPVQPSESPRVTLRRPALCRELECIRTALRRARSAEWKACTTQHSTVRWVRPVQPYAEPCNAVSHQTSPWGVQVDSGMVAELAATGKFDYMSRHVDEAEHSLEMHLPYIQHCMQGKPFTLVPIMVGALSPESEELYGQVRIPSTAAVPANRQATRYQVSPASPTPTSPQHRVTVRCPTRL